MPFDKLVDSAKLDGALKSTADAIRAKTGGTENIPWSETEGFKSAVEGITAGGGSDGGNSLPFITTRTKVGNNATISEFINLDVVSDVRDESLPSDSLIVDMRKWLKNPPAREAFTSIVYNDNEKLNTCQYTGVGMFEIIGIPLLLEASKKYTFSVDYYAPNSLIGDYAETYAPYLAFLPLFNARIADDPFSKSYVHTKMALSVSDYTTYVCEYTPGSTVAGCAAFVMGSTRDGISLELRLKNISLSIE